MTCWSGQNNGENDDTDDDQVSGQTSMFNNRYYANLVGTSWRLNSRACTELNGVEASLCGEGQVSHLATIFSLDYSQEGE